MTTKTAHFKVSDSAKDRMKVPGTFWALIRSMGLTPAAVLRHSDLPLTMYTRECELTTAQLFSIWRSVRELGKDPTLGWKGFRDVKSEQFHPTLLAALNARTYRESLERLARYKQLCGAQEFRFSEDDAEFLIEVSWPFAAGEQAPALLLDANFALVVELGRRGTATTLTPKRIELARPEDPEDGLRDYFGCPIEYAARRDVLILRTKTLALPFFAHNEELLRMLAPQLEGQLKAVRSKQTTHERVKWVLKRLLAGNRPDIGVVARELGMSGRTLQRRISEEGTRFRLLLNETRQELVREYLADDSVEIAEAAFLLGYEDANSFYRAFRSWTGTTPAEWRTANRRPHGK
jgi:AraC-like DNA-binding protein